MLLKMIQFMKFKSRSVMPCIRILFCLLPTIFRENRSGWHIRYYVTGSKIITRQVDKGQEIIIWTRIIAYACVEINRKCMQVWLPCGQFLPKLRMYLINFARRQDIRAKRNVTSFLYRFYFIYFILVWLTLCHRSFDLRGGAVKRMHKR